jgi:hypothetical protein
MAWLAAILVVLALALVASPATVGAVGALIGHAENQQSINYISREIHELRVVRRRALFRRKLERLSGKTLP